MRKGSVDRDASGLHALFGALIDFDLLFEMMPGTFATGQE